METMAVPLLLAGAWLVCLLGAVALCVAASYGDMQLGPDLRASVARDAGACTDQPLEVLGACVTGDDLPARSRGPSFLAR